MWLDERKVITIVGLFSHWFSLEAEKTYGDSPK